MTSDSASPPPPPLPSGGPPPISAAPAPAFSPPPLTAGALPPPAATSGRRPNTGLIIAIVAAFLLIVGGVTVFAIIKLVPQAQTALGRIKTPDQQRREREALQKLEEARRETVAEQRRALESPDRDTITGSTERVDRARALLAETSGQFKGDDRVAMEIVQRYLATMRDKTQAYETAAGAIKQADFFAPGSLKTKEAINARRELVKKWIATNDDLTLCLSTLESDIRTELEKMPATRDSAAATARSYARNANIDRALKIRDYDRQKGKNALATLDLLLSSWGQWKVDASGVVRFNRKETLARFNEIQKSITAADESQLALQREMLNAQSQPMAAPPGRVPSSSAASPAPASQSGKR